MTKSTQYQIAEYLQLNGTATAVTLAKVFNLRAHTMRTNLNFMKRYKFVSAKGYPATWKFEKLPDPILNRPEASKAARGLAALCQTAHVDTRVKSQTYHEGFYKPELNAIQAFPVVRL